jgi:hypothetical protein
MYWRVKNRRFCESESDKDPKQKTTAHISLRIIDRLKEEWWTLKQTCSLKWLPLTGFGC